MSHASLLVAIDGDTVKKHGGIEKAVEWNMAPFDENKEWFRDGSRWDWYQIGGRYEGKFGGNDIALLKDVDEKTQRAGYHKDIRKWFKEAEAYLKQDHGQEVDEFTMSMRFGVDPRKEKLEQLLQQSDEGPWFPSFYAFLSNRQWHENGRLGWFGMQVKSECAIRGRDKGKCLVKDEKLGARIIGWNREEADWRAKFYDRFVKPLDPLTTLVSVDYHV